MAKSSARGASSSTASTSRQSKGPLKQRSPTQLVELCEQAYTGFNPARLTLDSHADECVKNFKINNPDEENFLRQVLYGVVRYRKLLEAFTTSFYYKNSGEILRADVHIYKIYAYLTIFRLEELSFPQYRRLVVATAPQKMLVFLRYLFDEEILREVLRGDWLKIYDKQYVDGLIEGLLKWKPDVDGLMKDLGNKVYMAKKREDSNASIQHCKKCTVVRPFNLTQPKVRPTPPEERPPPQIKANPPPPRLSGPTKEERAIEAAKAINRKRQERTYSDPQRQPFRLKVLERPTNIEKLSQEVEEEVSKELTFKAPKPKPAPQPPDAQVKLNAASILREDAVYRKKQMDEAEMLKRYEQELRDDSEFSEWQKEALEQDDREQKAHVKRRKDEMVAAQEAAIKARSDMVEYNQNLGRQQKAEARQLEENLSRERKQLVKANAKKRDQVISDKAKIGKAVEKVVLDKKSRAEEVRQREANDARKRTEALAKEAEERKDVIRQLKALERAPQKRVKVFDPTEVADHGLLEEMSLLELRERLAMVKRRQHDKVERKRSEIFKVKQEREAMLIEKASNIQRVRSLSHEQAEERRNEKKRLALEDAEKWRMKHEQDVLTLHENLKTKRSAQAAEKARLAAEEKRIKFEQQQQAAGAHQVEENKFNELRSGAKRELVARQTEKIDDARVMEDTAKLAQRVRMRFVRKQAAIKKDFLKAYDEKVEELRGEHNGRVAEDAAYRKSLVEKQKMFETQQKEKHDKASYKPFSSTQSTTQARLNALAAGKAVSPPV